MTAKKTITLLALLFLVVFGKAQTANFTVSYEHDPAHGQGWPPAAKSAFDHAVGIWEQAISSKFEIRVDAFYESLVSRNGGDSSFAYVLGRAAPLMGVGFNSSSPKFQPDTRYPAALAEKLADSDAIWAQPLDFHIIVHMNDTLPNNSTWYFGTSASGIGPNQYDFISVVIHELAHGLGFNSSARFDTMLQQLTYDDIIPNIYDRFVYNNATATKMTSLPATGATTTGFLTSNSLYFDGSDATSQNNGRPKLYAPSPWEQGSSVSHWDQGTFGTLDNDALMHPQSGLANSHLYRNIGNVTLGLMRDIGWDDFNNVEELDASMYFNVYPNPAPDVAVVKLSKTASDYHLTLFDLYGREVKRWNALNTNEILIPVRDLQEGVYTLCLTNNENKLKNTKKLIVTH